MLRHSVSVHYALAGLLLLVVAGSTASGGRAMRMSSARCSAPLWGMQMLLHA